MNSIIIFVAGVIVTVAVMVLVVMLVMLLKTFKALKITSVTLENDKAQIDEVWRKIVEMDEDTTRKVRGLKFKILAHIESLSRDLDLRIIGVDERIDDLNSLLDSRLDKVHNIIQKLSN